MRAPCGAAAALYLAMVAATFAAPKSSWQAMSAPLIDSRGFLRDLLPVLDYGPEEEPEEAEASSSAAAGEGGEGAAAPAPAPEPHAARQIVRARTRCYMRARQVPGDGACLFHALTAGLWRAVNGSHHPMERKALRAQSLRLRTLAIDVLEDSRDPRLYMGDTEKLRASKLLRLAAEQSELSPAAYCAKLREPHAWGGGPEIVALSNALRRPIHVYELLWARADPPCVSPPKRPPPPSRDDGDAPESGDDDDGPAPKWCLQCIAEFGSPRFDRRSPPLHILSCDSRFPNLSPEQQLDQGNHFLLLFECDPADARDAARDDGADAGSADALFAAAAKRAADVALGVAKNRDLDVSPYFAKATALSRTASNTAADALKRCAAPLGLVLCATPFVGGFLKKRRFLDDAPALD